MRKEKLEELKSYIEELKTIKKTKKEIEFDKNKKPKTFFEIEKYEYYLNNGRTITREKILKNHQPGSAAIVLPITKDKNTLLIVQSRPNTKETVCIELPAGYIEYKEDPRLAAIRELEEETGYIPERLQLLDTYYQDQGCYEAFNYSFLALDCTKKKQQNLDKDEIIKYFECTYEEALELVNMGYILDINSKYALEKSKKYLKSK